MKMITVYNKLRQQEVPIFSTNDAAIILDVSNQYANTLLRRLAKENLITHLRRGLWGFAERIDPLALPNYLTAPAPSYVSLQSALYYHGIISQIPIVIYIVSLARTRQYHTSLGTYSIHHMSPNLFLGFDIIGEQRICMANKEKALFDFYYFRTAKSKLFHSLPEVEIPDEFSWEKFFHFNKLVTNISRRTMIQNLAEKLTHE